MADSTLLRRAATCYLAVGDRASAARCLRDAGVGVRAGALYAEVSMFRDAAAAYLDAGSADVAGWILAHELHDAVSAREVVARHAPRQATDPSGADAVPPTLSEMRELRDRITQVRRDKESALDAQDFERAAVLHREQRSLAAEERALQHDRGLSVQLRWQLVNARCDVIDRAPAARVLRVLGGVQHALASGVEMDAPPIERWAIEVAMAIRRFDQVALVFAASVRGRRAGADDRWQKWSSSVLRVELTLPRGEES